MDRIFQVKELVYEKPLWSTSPPLDTFYLEVIKLNSIVLRVPLNKEIFVIGRCDQNLVDILSSHESVSRFHAIITYSNGLIDDKKDEGFYIWDLQSTNGTYLNNQVVGNIFKFFKINDEISLGTSSISYKLRKLNNILFKDINKYSIIEQNIKKYPKCKFKGYIHNFCKSNKDDSVIYACQFKHKGCYGKLKMKDQVIVSYRDHNCEINQENSKS